MLFLIAPVFIASLTALATFGLIGYILYYSIYGYRRKMIIDIKKVAQHFKLKFQLPTKNKYSHRFKSPQIYGRYQKRYLRIAIFHPFITNRKTHSLHITLNSRKDAAFNLTIQRKGFWDRYKALLWKKKYIHTDFPLLNDLYLIKSTNKELANSFLSNPEVSMFFIQNSTQLKGTSIQIQGRKLNFIIYAKFTPKLIPEIEAGIEKLEQIEQQIIGK